MLGKLRRQIQAFSAAAAPPQGARREGDVYLKLLGRHEMFNAQDIRNEMGEAFASLKIPTDKAAEPAFEFVEL